MKRTGFTRKVKPIERDADRVRSTPSAPAAWTEAARIDPEAWTALAPAKEHALQHGRYMRLVRLMPCARCGKAGPSQFCHADMGKGMGIKTDCRRGFPGCPECHVLLGSSGKFPREQRREMEAEYGARTRLEVEAIGWPASLPRWPK